MILIVDNYDSFTYNLVDLISRFTETYVVRNDEIPASAIPKMNPAGIVISPGPGRPEDSGISRQIVSRYHADYPILGVCLGHQVIAEYFGAKVLHATQPMHGKTSFIHHKNTGIFEGVVQPLRVMRYHSLIVDPQTVPESIEISAWTDTQEVMGIRHKIYNLSGVQFHPESILSEAGEQMINNWLTSIRTLKINP